MKNEEIIEVARELMKKALVGYLATIDSNGEPQIRAVENMRNPDKFPHEAKILSEYDQDINAYISTNTSSVKVTQIIENNSAAIYFCSPVEYKGIMLQGYVEIINDSDLKKRIWQDSMLRYYPKGHTDPDHTILKLIPKYLKTWYNTRKDELKMSK
ncbi:MAG: pyridoxamine 5'-phosphate oxidase family protein [Candidatus Heimdallarchaeota archaeon]